MWESRLTLALKVEAVLYVRSAGFEPHECAPSHIVNILFLNAPVCPESYC